MSRDYLQQLNLATMIDTRIDTRGLSESPAHHAFHRPGTVRFNDGGGGRKEKDRQEPAFANTRSAGFPLYFLREPCTVRAYETD